MQSFKSFLYFCRLSKVSVRSGYKGNLFSNTTTHGRFYNIKTRNMAKEYNPKNANSILKHGEKLLGHSLRELHPEAIAPHGKGGLGEAVEEFHYGYKPNSVAEPDFKEAGLELKCTPLKELKKDQSMAAKERLVLNIINYIEEAKETFETSSFWKKNKLLLLMFYLHVANVNPVDLVFKLIRKWNIIHSKILHGQAQELSEGDTFYLAACMKGSKAKEDMRDQPGTNERAQQRAYSLKTGYMNKIILDSFLDEGINHQLNITPKRLEKLQKKFASDKIVKSLRCYKPKETFEQLVIRRVESFYGKTVEKIGKKRKVKLNVKAKDLAYNVCRAIFNIKTRKIQEFENANISLKTIVLEANRDKIIESMSFPYIRFVDIINEEWEDSEWHKQLSGKFLFVVFRKSPDGDKRKMKLVKVFFWNMPYNDLVEAKNLWEDTKQKVCNGDYDHFITSKANGICHVRPHGTKGQTVLTSQGNRVQPKCFWLNNDYILNIVLNELN